MRWLSEWFKRVYLEQTYRRLKYQREQIGCKMTMNQLMDWWIDSHRLIRFAPDDKKEEYWTGLGGYGTLADKIARQGSVG